MSLAQSLHLKQLHASWRYFLTVALDHCRSGQLRVGDLVAHSRYDVNYAYRKIKKGRRWSVEDEIVPAVCVTTVYMVSDIIPGNSNGYE